MTGFNLTVDFRTVAWARIYQSVGIAFLFVPINTAAYAFMPPGKSNAVSALINLGRNIGGSAGISLVTTVLERRSQVHQDFLVEHMNAYSDRFQVALAGAKKALTAGGSSPTQAAAQAYGQLYALLGTAAPGDDARLHRLLLDPGRSRFW